MFSANQNIQLRQHKKRVVDYVESTIPEEVLDLGVNVMAMEVSCKAPGCVPLETAIVIVFPKSSQELLSGLPESAGGSYKTKVLKPMSAVTKDDVLEALPPSFEGGKRSVERLCLQARDVMLGQITQLFGDEDEAGRKLMATYLQQSLQDYMDRGCEPPEWGEAFPSIKTNKATPSSEKSSTTATNNHNNTIVRGTGNVVIQRPVDDEEEVEGGNTTKSATTAATTQPASQSSSSAATSTAASKATTTSSSKVVSVDTVTRRRQQQAAERKLRNGSNGVASSSLLSQLAEREHAPGIRRPGCPCCDPDNPSNVVDQLMQF